jgi:hypothetical protein
MSGRGQHSLDLVTWLAGCNNVACCVLPDAPTLATHWFDNFACWESLRFNFINKIIKFASGDNRVRGSCHGADSEQQQQPAGCKVLPCMT